MHATQKNMTPELSIVLFDEKFHDQISSKRHLKIYKSLKTKNLVDHKNIFIVSKATNLFDLSDFIREANKRNHLKALFIRPDIDKEIIPKMMYSANVRSLRNTLIHQTPEMLKRILNAWEIGAQDQLIADANISNDKLYVLSCSLKMYSVLMDEIPALKEMNVKFRRKFSLAEDGRFIHWEKNDIHIDIETLEYHTNVKFRRKSDLKKLQYYQNLGTNIKKIREVTGIYQSDIPGLSARQVRRIENGETQPTTKALDKMASALNMSLDDFLNKLAVYS